MKRLYIFIAASLILTRLIAQQDPLMGDYQFNQLFLNPAYSGVNDRTSFDLKYRTQWIGVEGAPNTAFLSGTTSLLKNHIGVGFTLIHDQIGINRNTEFNTTYAYQLDLIRDMKLSFGMSAGLIALQYDYEKLNLDDLTDEDFLNTDQEITTLNIGTGLFLSGQNYYLGLSVPRLLKVTETANEVNSTRYNTHYYISGGYLPDLTFFFKLKPYFLLRVAEDSPMSLDVGATTIWGDMLRVGLFTRDLHVFGLNTYLVLSDGIRVGYTGELATNNAPSTEFSTHEVSVGIDLQLFGDQEKRTRYY